MRSNLLLALAAAPVAVVVGLASPRYASPALLVLASLVAVIVMASRRSIYLLFLLSFLALFSLGRLYIQFGPNPFNSGRLMQAFLLGSLMLALQRGLARGKRPLLPAQVVAGLAVYLVGTFGSAAMSTSPVVDQTEYTNYLIMLAQAPMAMCAAYALLDTERDAATTLRLLFGVGIVQALLGWVQVLVPDPFQAAVKPFEPFASFASGASMLLEQGRAMGLWPSAPIFGMVMASCISPGVYTLLSAQSAWSRALAGAGLLVVASGVVLSGSLASLFTTGFSLLCFLLIGRGSKVTALGAALAVLAVLLGIYLLGGVRGFDVAGLRRATDPSEADLSSWSGRLIMWDAALQMWAQEPLFGIGVGQFLTRYVMQGAAATHNVYLQMLTERGAIGLLASVAVFLVFVGSSVSSLRNEKTDSRQLVKLSLLLVPAAILLGSAVDNGFNIAGLHYLVWLSFGVSLRLAELPLEEKLPSTEATLVRRSGRLSRA